VIHLAAVAVIYALVTSDLLSFSPPAGRQSVQLAASLAASEMPTPAIVIAAQPAEVAPAPRRIAIVPRGELPPVAGDGQYDIDLPETTFPPPVESLAPRRTTNQPLPQQTESPIASRIAKSASAQAPPSTTTAESAKTSVASQASQGAKTDSLPTAAFCPEPIYPPALLAARIEGQVVLRLSVAADGTVVEVVVERSSGYVAMDEAALTAVRKWRFHPAQRFGMPVAVQVRKPLRFAIELNP
jgi:protein TonB